MSGLEQAVAPLLATAFFGKTASWNLEEQLTVATWATKTAFMLDRSSEAGQKVPIQHFRELHDHRQPIRAGQIAVGFYRPEDGETKLGVTAGVGRGAPTHRDSYRICFSIGQVVFVVHGYSGQGRAPLHVQPFAEHGSKLLVPLWNTLPSLWPRTDAEFHWPPPNGFALNTASLERLTDDPLMAPLVI